MTTILPITVSIVGLIIFGFSDNAKLQSVGRDMFFAGLFVFLFQCAALKFPI